MNRVPSEPKISVLMPLYNDAEYFPEAIESILCQTFSDFEIVVIEDGSDDASPDLLRAYAKRDRRISPIFLKNNSGLATARQTGLEASRAAVVANMDADDISHPERLQRQYGYLQCHRSVVIVGCALSYFVENKGKKRIVGHTLAPGTRARQFDRFYRIAKVPVLVNSSMYRREVALRVGGYRTFFCYGAEDKDFGLRMHEHGQVANLPEVLCGYRVNASSLFRRHRRIHGDAGGVMAVFCALKRRSGASDPIDLAHPLESLPRVLGLPSAVKLDDVQKNPYWATELFLAWLAHKPFDRRLRATIYLRLLRFAKQGEGGNSRVVRCFARAFRLDAVGSVMLLLKSVVNLLFIVVIRIFLRTPLFLKS